jgi:hypothetical protein
MMTVGQLKEVAITKMLREELTLNQFTDWCLIDPGIDRVDRPSRSLFAGVQSMDMSKVRSIDRALYELIYLLTYSKYSFTCSLLNDVKL